MTKKFMTIVIEYEGEPPIKGFGIPVLGCEVTALSMGNEIERSFLLEEKLGRMGADEDED